MALAQKYAADLEAYDTMKKSLKADFDWRYSNTSSDEKVEPEYPRIPWQVMLAQHLMWALPSLAMMIVKVEGKHSGYDITESYGAAASQAGKAVEPDATEVKRGIYGGADRRCLANATGLSKNGEEQQDGSWMLADDIFGN
jgi:hypothetical protein